jgi:hypothetical protein
MVAVGKAAVAIGSSRLQEFAHSPLMVRDSSLHGRGDTQAFVDAAEIVEGVPERDSSPVIFSLL